MTSKAQRKRRKRRITLPGGASIPQPEHGLPRLHRKPPRETEESAMQTVIEARRRQLGDIADTVDLRSPMAAEALGHAILRHPRINGYPPDMLWAAVTHIRRTVAAYDRACGAPGRHPRCLGILTPAEHIAATADSPPADLRSPEDRDRAAVTAWTRLQGWLSHADAAARSACMSAAADDAPPANLPGIIRALQCVCDGQSGTTIRLRYPPAP